MILVKYLFRLNLLLLFFVSIAFGASFHNFEYQDSQAVLIDIQDARYDVVIDFNKNTSIVTSKITFKQSKKGYPIFDIRNTIKNVSIGNENVSAPEITSPKGDNQFRIINKVLAPGIYTFQVKRVILMNFQEE